VEQHLEGVVAIQIESGWLRKQPAMVLTTRRTSKEYNRSINENSKKQI
jgi:hypothetical protein